MTSASHDIRLSQLMSVLRYDPEVGHFTWVVDVGYKIKAGTRAGSTHRKSGYRFIIYKRAIYSEHILAWAFNHGEWPPRGKVVDHINCDGFDNRIGNLRLATVAENLRNTGAKRSNRLGIKGVCFARGRFRAEITVNYKKVYLGRFATVEEAAAAYAAAAARLHGEYARSTGWSHRSRHD